MNIKKEQKIKAQEWVVMFDGQIKKSEKEIDAHESQSLSRFFLFAHRTSPPILEL